MLTPNPIHTALEVLRTDRQALIDCHPSGAGIPSDDELALRALAQYDQAIKGLQDLQARLGTLPIRGVRVDGDTVVIRAKGGNDAARWLCHWLLLEQEHRAADAAAQPAGEPVAWRVHPHDYGIGSAGVYAMTARSDQVAAWERKGWAVEPLYTAPPAAARVPLTAAQTREAFEAWAANQPWLDDDEGHIDLRYLELHKQYVDMKVEHASRAFAAGIEAAGQEGGAA